MSRVGKQPIPIPEGVEVKIEPNRLLIKGPKGQLEVPYGGGITFKIENDQLIAIRPSDAKKHKALHGLYRSLAANAIKGVTEGYRIGMEVIGTGYRVELKKDALVFHVGYSHPVEIVIPEGIEVKPDPNPKVKNRFYIEGIDKYLVGQYAATIRSIRPPMRYKLKGIKYIDEVVHIKQGKAAQK